VRLQTLYASYDAVDDVIMGPEGDIFTIFNEKPLEPPTVPVL
jgi:hypothetical protein